MPKLWCSTSLQSTLKTIGSVGPNRRRSFFSLSRFGCIGDAMNLTSRLQGASVMVHSPQKNSGLNGPMACVHMSIVVTRTVCVSVSGMYAYPGNMNMVLACMLAKLQESRGSWVIYKLLASKCFDRGLCKFYDVDVMCSEETCLATSALVCRKLDLLQVAWPK